MAITVFAWPRDHYTAVGAGTFDRCRWPASLYEPAEAHFHPRASAEFRRDLKRSRKWTVKGQIVSTAPAE